MIIDSDEEEEEEVVGGGDGVRGEDGDGVREGGGDGDDDDVGGEGMDTSTCDSDEKRIVTSQEVHVPQLHTVGQVLIA